MKFILYKTTVLLILILITLSSCGQNQKKTADDHEGEKMEEGHDVHNEVVQLSEAELKEFGIILATAGSGKMETEVSLPGEIIIPPDNIAHIHARFAGIVKKVYKHIGDKIKKGDVLAVLESNESLADYQIKSMIDGTLIEKHFSLGEVVEGTSHGFVVADLSQVWAILKLYQKDLPYVKAGQKVIISAGQGMAETTAVINYISPMIDEETRTAAARVVLKNPNGLWKPGLFINGSITTSESHVKIIVPKTSLATIDGKTVVFVKDEDGFEPRAIISGRTNRLNVEILDGLSAGEVYVSDGVFTLKAELQKGEMSEGHGH